MSCRIINNNQFLNPDNERIDDGERNLIECQNIGPQLFAASSAQTEIWLAEQINPCSPVYNIGQYTEIRGRIDPALFEESLRAVIQEAETLRCRLIEVKGSIRAFVVASLDWSLPTVDFSSKADPAKEAARWMEVNFETPFDMKQEPLFYYALLKVAADHFIWYQRYHHSVMDGHSGVLVARRVAHFYSMRIRGRKVDKSYFSPISHLLGNDARYRGSFAFERDKKYWMRRCSDWPATVTLANRYAPALRHRLRQTAYISSQSLRDLFNDHSRLANQITVAVAVYLYRFTGVEEISLGFTVTARLGEDCLTPGMTANVLPIRLSVHHENSAMELMGQAAEQIRRGLRHQRYRSEVLGRDLDRHHTQPLFGPTVNLMPFDYGLSFGSCSSTTHNLGNATVNDLMVSIYSPLDGGEVRIDFDGNPDIYSEAELIGHQRRFLKVLGAVVDDSTQSIGRIDLLESDERNLLLKTWNRTETEYQLDRCIHQLFEEQTERTPEAVAIVHEGEQLSYAQLNARANRLAHQLIALGVAPDTRVAICVERSAAMIVGLLAILKAGGAYVPLDPAHPGERLAHILSDAQPAIVLADQTGKEVLGQASGGYTLIAPNDAPVQPETNPQIPGLTSRHLAYVIYTSGSTGAPKGVCIEHCSIVNYASYAAERFGVADGHGSVLSSSISFDLGLTALYPALIFGRRLYLSSAGNSDLDWRQAIADRNNLSPVKLTPSHLEALRGILPVEAMAGRICTLVVGGATLRHAQIEIWQTYAPETRIFNHYGPTETTVGCVVYEIKKSAEHSEPIPIGRPISNTRLYLLDSHGQPVPLGAVGELYIGGAGVARGYLNRPELTAERFLPDPFSHRSDARMYRTGDLARYLPDGNLVFLGRNDHQVKIRGFRVEPGEIEACLAEHPAIREAVVVALGDTDKRLVAYVTGNETSPGELRDWLASRLPDYMVPSAFVQLHALPLTPNGKLDRRALPAPDADSLAHAAYEAPVGALEIALADIWRELLGVHTVSRHDSFFALGGHSLLAVQMIERLRRLELSLAVRDLFQTPVLCALARVLGRHREVPVPPNQIALDCQTITPDLLPLIDLTQDEIDRIVANVPGGTSKIQDIYALSPLQDGILFHHLLATDGDPYLLLVQMAFTERDTLDRYLAAVQHVVNRHDILRTAFVWEGLSNPAQVVWRQAPLPVTELKLSPADGPVTVQLAERFDPHQYRIDLSQAPLLRFVVAQDEQGRWILLTLLHHLISDHSTLEVMQAEVRAFMEDRGATLPSPEPFRNLIAQARLGTATEEHERFFQAMLADVTEPTLPFGLVEVHRDGSQVGETRRMLSSNLNLRLRAQAKRLGVSLASLCHVAWAQVLARTSGQEQVVFGTVLFGRMQAGEGADRAMGLFINTLPLRLDMDEVSVAERVRHTHARLAELLEHEHASLALAQRCSGVPAGTPLFSALLNYRHNSIPFGETEANDTLSGIEMLSSHERTNYPFVLSVEDYGQALGVTAQVQSPIDSQRVCGYMEQALCSLADALEQTPGQPVRQLEVMSKAERELLLQTWNATEAPYPDQACIHQLFEEQTERTPEAIALVHENQQLKYAELNEKANRLAHRLILSGVAAGDYVATLLERSIDLIVAQLAILKAGAAYVPLDPQGPAERHAWILDDCSARLLITDVPEVPLPVAVLPPTDSGVAQSSPALRAAALDTAYVMYTSGSTGTPKGVLVPHRAVARLVMNNSYAKIGLDDRVAFVANPAFDASTFEVWGPLLNGGAVIIGDRHHVLDARGLAEIISRGNVTVLFITTALFNHFVPEIGSTFARLRLLLCGGEHEKPEIFGALLKHGGPEKLIHCYGPTESTTFSTTYEVSETNSGNRLPIGRPISNTRLYLLDSHGQPVPLGAVGELYIGGAGVARGYLNRPELTAERFLPDPFSHRSDARMYRTGDLARYLPDGNLVFLGRNDHQVKIRGFRVEPGEIEACLAEHPAIREAVVVALGDTDKRLVAYVTGNETSPGELRDWLASRLPDYMVPSAFVQLHALPLTPNGKLDRRALPAPDADSLAHAAYEAPVGALEIALADIWRELLGVHTVSRHDSFFALGGHSLLAVQMIERLRRLELSLAVRDLFQTPVLCALARVLGRHREVPVPPNQIALDCQTITPDLLPLIDLTQDEIDRIVANVPGGTSKIQDIYALSPLQDGILFHHLLATDGDPYLLLVQMAFTERDTLDRYLAAVQHVVNRHDILRTAFVWEGLSNPAQAVWRQAPLPVTELKLSPADGPVTVQLAERFDPHQYRIDLSQAPLLRFVVAQDEQGRWILLTLLHHLISDHSTLEVMQAEVRAFMEDRGATLPSPEPFRNLIAQARLGTATEEHERFFQAMLADVTEPTLPFGLVEVHRDGSQVGETRRMLSSNLNLRLRAQAKRLGVSLASLCHVAWAQVLARTSGQEQVVFGTVLFGRMQAGEGADRAMGLFINTLPLRLDMDEVSVAERVRHTHARLAELLEHEHASLALAQRCSGVPAGTPLFSALLNYRHNSIPFGETEANDTLSGIEMLSSHERTNYPFVLSVEDYGQALGVTAQVQSPIDSQRVCGYMEQALCSLADALEQTPGQPVRQLEVMSKAERELLLQTWNATEAPYPDQACIHQLFEEQTERTPEAVAIVHEGEQLSYAQLNARANRLAHQLIALGVAPDTRVAICVERSTAMIVGLLAILKAGGAYVPLDPAHPGERLAHILSDAQPAIVLADQTGKEVLGQASGGYTLIDPNDAPIQPETNPQIPGLTSRHLAYVIYTSGSTGVPKGVMVEHVSLVNLYSAMASEPGIAADDTVINLTSVSFDIAALELYLPLLSGAQLMLASRDVAIDPERLVGLIEQQAVTFVQATPAHWSVLLNHRWPNASFTLLCGGEALPASLAARMFDHVQVLWNMYGPTETTIWSATRRMVPGLDPSIGRPISNTRLYLLDSHGQPVPLGAVGELYIGGAGVARGYLNRPELTAERFLPDPFSHRSDARMYRTGDLARYLPDGNLVFLGRNDHQVKIRGFRVEPGEIEACLAEHPAIREAVVVALGDTDKRLVAYVTGNETSPGELRDWLASRLPDYMVPSAFLQLHALPLTPNGKLDRRALPAPDADSLAHATYEAPVGALEIALADIWRELLGVHTVSRHDSFFALGGHSLLAVQMVNQAAKRSMICTLNDIFQHSTLAKLALHINTYPSFTSNISAITIRSSGSEPPIFFVPDGSGDHSYAFSLSQSIKIDCPTYALPWPPNFDAPFSSIEDLAEKMANIIIGTQSNGPYRICGYCTGGILSYAIAKQLSDMGMEIDFVGLIDTPTPSTFRNDNLTIEQRFVMSISDHENTMPKEYINKIQEKIGKLNIEELIKLAQKLKILPKSIPIRVAVDHYKRIHNYVDMIKIYTAPPLHSIIHQFYALEKRDQGDHTSTQTHGWDKIIPSSYLFTNPLPGNHITLMTDKSNRTLLGSALSRILKAPNTHTSKCERL
ncbi:amino acid adenylation domain-containing protein [Paraburkholderia youngii]